jgi:hypothetical protein|tara:strand:- start:865 stop:1551 length:687 start_codon:yes stop_codon:yes gene_type:complete
MPTAQVGNLKSKYGQYLDAGAATDADWYKALNEIMPRIYQMGFWRDMMTTLEEQDVSTGYFTLPADDASTGVGYDSVLGAILDDSPISLYAMWHDYRLFGEPSPSAASDDTSLMVGVFDDGYSGAGGRRRYRISPVDSSTKATLLMRRKFVDVAIDAHLVFIPNNSTVIKHALLGKLSEDNADIQRAQYHWGICQDQIDSDLDSYRGGARPKLRVSPSGNSSGILGMY